MQSGKSMQTVGAVRNLKNGRPIFVGHEILNVAHFMDNHTKIAKCWLHAHNHPICEQKQPKLISKKFFCFNVSLLMIASVYSWLILTCSHSVQTYWPPFRGNFESVRFSRRWNFARIFVSSPVNWANDKNHPTFAPNRHSSNLMLSWCHPNETHWMAILGFDRVANFATTCYLLIQSEVFCNWKSANKNESFSWTMRCVPNMWAGIVDFGSNGSNLWMRFHKTFRKTPCSSR